MSTAVPESATWQIPICYKRSQDGRALPTACELLADRAHTFSIEGCSTWLFANADSRGYYRTSYDPDDLKALGTAIRRNDLTTVEQTSLLEDVWALAKLNQQNLVDFLSLGNDVAALGPSQPIETVAVYLNYISDRLIDDSQRPAFERWVRRLLQPLHEKLGWNARPARTTS
jgi:hypothetical protein